MVNHKKIIAIFLEAAPVPVVGENILAGIAAKDNVIYRPGHM
jgi:hypothetical protein